MDLVGELTGSVEQAVAAKNIEFTPSGTVKSVTLDTENLDEAAFELFARQPDLEKLLISNYRDLDDMMVEMLAPLENLKAFRAANSSLTNEGVTLIVKQFPHLRELDLSSNTLLTSEATQEMAKLTELENLAIRYCNFDDFSMIDIAKLPKLKVLDIRANMLITSTGFGFLGKMPSLANLMHMSGAIDDRGMEALSKAKNITALHMQDFRITDQASESLKKFTKLNSLVLFRCSNFTSQGLLALKGLPLNRLTLRALPGVDDAGMAFFGDVPKLRRLYLQELPSVSDVGLTQLANLKDLEVLDIWAIPMSNKSLETIGKLENLRELSIRTTDITDAAIDPILALPKLQRLTLKDNAKITESGKQKLRDNAAKFAKLDLGL